MERSVIVELLNKYHRGALTLDERARLETWADRHPSNRKLLTNTADQAWLSQALRDYDAILPADEETTAATLAQHIIDHSAQPRSIKMSRFHRWIPYAAAVLLILSIGMIRYWDQLSPRQSTRSTNQYGSAVLPGGNRATLTVTNGETIDLSTQQTGIVVSDAGITYTDGNPLISTDAAQGDDHVQLALSTPRGGQYHVTLHDGTNVWLNAASTLRYPAHFTGDLREVELIGEGYFEVAKDIHKPFKVTSKGQRVEVLGTVFNISAYPDDQEVRTTLVEGKVNVIAGHPQTGSTSIMLSPSEQARNKDGRLTKARADMHQELAWRNGLFAFHSEKIGDIMRKVARWYDVEVEFHGDVANRTFTGTISRYANINEVLETLALTDRLQFELQHRTILVKPM